MRYAVLLVLIFASLLLSQQPYSQSGTANPAAAYCYFMKTPYLFREFPSSDHAISGQFALNQNYLLYGHHLYITEPISFTGDVVIYASVLEWGVNGQIKTNGGNVFIFCQKQLITPAIKSQQPHICTTSSTKKSGNVYIFAEQIKGLLSIDTRGSNGKDGLPGGNGKDGLPGTKGQDGMDAQYEILLSGEQLADVYFTRLPTAGMVGTNGQDGYDGMPGTNGENGQDGGDVWIATNTTIPATDWNPSTYGPSYPLDHNPNSNCPWGEILTQGGSGGLGGKGGLGGNPGLPGRNGRDGIIPSWGIYQSHPKRYWQVPNKFQLPKLDDEKVLAAIGQGMEFPQNISRIAQQNQISTRLLQFWVDLANSGLDDSAIPLFDGALEQAVALKEPPMVYSVKAKAQPGTPGNAGQDGKPGNPGKSGKMNKYPLYSFGDQPWVKQIQTTINMAKKN